MPLRETAPCAYLYVPSLCARTDTAPAFRNDGISPFSLSHCAPSEFAHCVSKRRPPLLLMLYFFPTRYIKKIARLLIAQYSLQISYERKKLNLEDSDRGLLVTTLPTPIDTFGSVSLIPHRRRSQGRFTRSIVLDLFSTVPFSFTTGEPSVCMLFRLNIPYCTHRIYYQNLPLPIQLSLKLFIYLS